MICTQATFDLFGFIDYTVLATIFGALFISACCNNHDNLTMKSIDNESPAAQVNGRVVLNVLALR